MANKPFKYLKTSPTGDSYTPVDETARNRIGDLSQLTTEHKSNLVEAINDAAQSGGGGGGAELPNGGTKGQVLTKKSSTDGDADWEFPIVVLNASGEDDEHLSISWSEDYTTFDLFSHQELMKARSSHGDYFLSLTEAYLSYDPDTLDPLYVFNFGAIIDIGENSATVATLHVISNNAMAHSASGVFETHVIATATNKSDVGLGNVDNVRQYSSINPPPYPVTSVNGQTGAVTVSPASNQQVQDAVDAYLDEHPAMTGMFTNEAKNALLALLEKVAYIDQNGQTYLNNLRTLLAATVTSISAVFTQGANVVYDTDSLDSLKPMLVVTATYSDGTSGTLLDSEYTLSGTLTVGTSTITVTCGEATDILTVAVTHGFLYTPDKGLLTAQSYISSNTNSTDSGTETIDNNYLKFHCNTTSGSTKAWVIEMADFDAVTSGTMTIQFYLTSIGTITQANTTTPGTVMFQVFDGTTGGVVGGLAKHGNTSVPIVRKTVGTTVSWTAQDVSYNEWHELIIEYSDGKQSVSLDSTTVFSNENPSTTTGYFAHTGLRLMETSTVLNMYIRKIEVTIE